MGWQQTANDMTEVQVSSDKCNYVKSSGVPSFVRLCSSMRKMGYSTCSIKPVKR